MTQITDLFDPIVLFSKENPYFKFAEKTHRRIFESFDRTVRLNLSYTADLLDLNRERFDALYADENLLDKVWAHQDLAIEISKRTATWAGDLQEVAIELGSGVSEVVRELVSPDAGKGRAAKAK